MVDETLVDETAAPAGAAVEPRSWLVVDSRDKVFFRVPRGTGGFRGMES